MIAYTFSASQRETGSPQNRGFCGERTSDGMIELSGLPGSERYVVREDEADAKRLKAYGREADVCRGFGGSPQQADGAVFPSGRTGERRACYAMCI